MYIFTPLHTGTRMIYTASHSVICYTRAPSDITAFWPLPQPKLVFDLASPEGCKAEAELAQAAAKHRLQPAPAYLAAAWDRLQITNCPTPVMVIDQFVTRVSARRCAMQTIVTDNTLVYQRSPSNPRVPWASGLRTYLHPIIRLVRYVNACSSNSSKIL